MGYSSDQFYNFNVYEGANSSLARQANDNPTFLFPGNRMTNVFGGGIDTRMQRGFIRGIYPKVMGGNTYTSTAKIKQRRLFFQFNPATIERNVQMNTTVYNPLLQPAINLVQPVPGNSEFSFELLFDRQAEMNTGRYIDEKDRYVPKVFNAVLDSYKQSDVTELGVLADLYVLDTIIGQSISSDMKDFLKDYWSYIDTTLGSTQTAVDTTNADAGTTTTQDSLSIGNWEKNVDKNIGNAAFLAPLPIRIVFSSLFMVEGFVNSSSVQFIKFTKNYVPTMCKVTLNVTALYFGFARQNSFLSDAIAQQVVDTVETKKEDTKLATTAQQLANGGAVFKFNLKDLSMASGTGTFEQDFESTTGIIRGSFDLETYTSATFTKAVEEQRLSFDFSNTLEMIAYSSSYPSSEGGVSAPTYNGKYGKVILTDTLKYSKKNTGLYNEDISSSEIATNAVKSNDPNKPRQNKAFFASDPLTRAIPSDAIIQIKITNTTTVTYVPQLLSAPVSVSSTKEDYVYFNADNTGISDYNAWVTGQTTFIIQGNSNNPSSRNAL